MWKIKENVYELRNKKNNFVSFPPFVTVAAFIFHSICLPKDFEKKNLKLFSWFSFFNLGNSKLKSDVNYFFLRRDRAII